MQGSFQVSHIDQQLDGRNREPGDVATFRFCGSLDKDDEDGAFLVNLRYVPDQNDPCPRDENGFCYVKRSAKIQAHEKKAKKEK
ncbi:hypothetical protein [Nitrospira sp. Kam-Ns4a]